MEMMNLVTSPFGLGEKVIFELLKRGETVFTIFISPKDVPMSFLGKINLKYGFLKFDHELNIGKILPKKIKNIFHLYEAYTGTLPNLFKSNTLATLLLLDWAKSSSVSKFIYLSTGEVYGQGQAVSENSVYNPRGFYATTKFEAEVLLRFYRTFEINTVRLFFPFGRNLNQGHAANLVQAIQSDNPIETEYGVIAPTFIDDIIEPLIKAREIKGNQIFNICGGSIQVSALVDEISKIYNKASRNVKIGKTELSGNNSKAKELLGYKETPLQEALKSSFEK